MCNSANDIRIDIVPGAPPHEDTSDKDTIDHQKPHLTGTPEPTKIKTQRHVGAVENMGRKAYSKATGLCNKL